MNNEKKVIRHLLIDKRIEQQGKGWLVQIAPIILKYIEKIEDIHIVSLEPNATRGNHFHLQRTEIIFPLFGRNTIAWKEDNQIIEVQPLPATELLIIPSGVTHAIRNDGIVASIVVAFSSVPFQTDNPDRYTNTILVSR